VVDSVSFGPTWAATGSPLPAATNFPITGPALDPWIYDSNFLSGAIVRLADVLVRRFDLSIERGQLLLGFRRGDARGLRRYLRLEHAALDRGFAVSRVALSREVSCHQFQHFYARVATALRTPDSAIGGLHAPLLRAGREGLAASAFRQPGRYAHPLPALVLEDFFHTEGEEQQTLHGALMGTPIAIPELRRIHRTFRAESLPRFEDRYRPAVHSPAFFGVMADAVRYCGFRGWVLLIDEVELLGRLPKAGRLAAYRNLNWLLNWSGGMRFPIYTVAAAASRLKTERMYEGDGRGADDRTVMPDLARLKLGADAGQELDDFFKTALTNHCQTVGQVSPAQSAIVLEAVARLHGAAYEWSSRLDVGDVLKRNPNVPVRTQIRATLEALDLELQYGAATVPEAAVLVESSVTEDEGLFAAPAVEEPRASEIAL
jgi:hypothetical protein